MKNEKNKTTTKRAEINNDNEENRNISNKKRKTKTGNDKLSKDSDRSTQKLRKKRKSKNDKQQVGERTRKKYKKKIKEHVIPEYLKGVEYKTMVENKYPDCLCINSHNILQFAHIHQNSIKITDIDNDTLNWLKYAGTQIKKIQRITIFRKINK